MALLSIMLYTAVPRVSQLLESFSKRDAEMMVLQDMRLAQATTVEQGCQGIIKVNADRKSYSFGCDYVPFSTLTPPVYDTSIFVRLLPAKVRVSVDSDIIFNSRGQAVDSTGAMVTRTLTLRVVDSGVESTFNTGTLRATGFFTYQN